ncbi:MAG TPA: hypothetical protein VFD90_13750 [Gaiellales bacterium]|nr:hypothetical protein [Gaiellales bacterium]
MISNTAKTIAAAFTVAAALGATTVQSASAKSGPGVRIAGTCSETSASKLKVKQDNGRLQVEFEVDQNRVGVPWTVELRKDGRIVFKGTRTTIAPSGSFSLERRIAGTTGAITASATRAGEGCTASTQGPKLVKAIAAAQPAANANGNVVAGHDVNDDNGNHVGVDDSGHHTGTDDSGHHGNDD